MYIEILVVIFVVKLEIDARQLKALYNNNVIAFLFIDILYFTSSDDHLHAT